jgi:lysophospholipase L1-like esterase
VIFLLGLLLASASVAAAGGDGNEHWVATWSTTLLAPEILPGLSNAGFNNQTVRQIVHISIGGDRVRLRLSTFGADALAVGAAHIALSAGDSTIVDENHRWTDELARRIVQQNAHAMGMLNEGMDGNRLLHDVLGPNGLERFERDVLSQPGLAYVIVLLGNADIGTGWPGGLNPDQAVTVDQILQGYKQLIEAAHTRGVKIYGATLNPFEGAFVPGTPFPLYSPENEIKRQQVNHWIRTSGAFDGVIDFDRVLRDPNARSRLLPKCDSGDHVHPNDAGYSAMADAIDLRLFSN